MFVEFFWRCQCPDCKARNWVYDTHSERSYSSNDNFAIKCWSCGKCNWLDDEMESEAKSMYGDDVEIEDVAVLGKENP